MHDSQTTRTDIRIYLHTYSKYTHILTNLQMYKHLLHTHVSEDQLAGGDTVRWSKSQQHRDK